MRDEPLGLTYFLSALCAGQCQRWIVHSPTPSPSAPLSVEDEEEEKHKRGSCSRLPYPLRLFVLHLMSGVSTQNIASLTKLLIEFVDFLAKI